MTSVVNYTGVELAAPSGDSASVTVDDVDGGEKIAPAVVVVDQTGAIIGFATEVTAQSILTALETGVAVTLTGESTVSISGTVAISAASLPLPTGAATNTELVTINSTLGTPAQDGTGGILGTISSTLSSILTKLGAVVLAAGNAIIGKVGIDQTTPGTTNKVTLGSDTVTVGGTVAISSLPQGQTISADSTSVVIASDQTVPVSLASSAPVPTRSDSDAIMIRAIESLSNIFNMAQDLATGRLRVLIDPLGGAQTLGTVTTVSAVTTVTNLNQQAGVDIYQTQIMELFQTSWVESVRSRMT